MSLPSWTRVHEVVTTNSSAAMPLPKGYSCLFMITWLTKSNVISFRVCTCSNKHCTADIPLDSSVASPPTRFFMNSFFLQRCINITAWTEARCSRFPVWAVGRRWWVWQEEHKPSRFTRATCLIENWLRQQAFIFYFWSLFISLASLWNIFLPHHDSPFVFQHCSFYYSITSRNENMCYEYAFTKVSYCGREDERQFLYNFFFFSNCHGVCWRIQVTNMKKMNISLLSGFWFAFHLPKNVACDRQSWGRRCSALRRIPKR